jgi:mono/diheme cytochrome c family protein
MRRFGHGSRAIVRMPRLPARAAWLLALMPCLVALAGCERSFRDMYDQPRYKPLAASALWRDGRASRPPVQGTVAHSAGTFAGSSSGRREPVPPDPVTRPLAAIRDDLRPPARDAATTSTGQAVSGTPAELSGVSSFAMPSITAGLLARGRDRFDAFCSPCHGVAGDGVGFVSRRGFPHPPSYHSERLRNASDEHLYAVITDGYGAMYPYATRLAPPDRLAVVAYVRALQLSQHAPLSAVPAAQRSALERRR